jgi:anti-sigma factor RsiW
MEHPADATLLEWIDGRLPGSIAAPLELHVGGCRTCTAEAERLRLLSATLERALSVLDPAVPTQMAYAALRRRRRAAWMPGGRRALARAAVLLMAVAGIASATLPGSPLRAWIGERFGGAAEAPSGVRPPAAPAEPLAGVEILPREGSVRVVLTNAGGGVRVRVRLADAEYVDVRGTGAAAGARFRTAPGRITVDGAEGGEVHIALPRRLRHAVVTVGGRTYLVKEGERMRVLTTEVDSVGSELVFRVGP